MAVNAVDEALRNLAAVGCPPDRAALLDNFTWGNPDRPEVLGALVRASRGCHDAAVAFGAPFVSGKDSLNNEFAHEGETITIPCTLLISAMGVLDDASVAVTLDLKGPGNRLYLAGWTRCELGASHLHLLHGAAGGRIPRVDLNRAPVLLDRAASTVRQGLALSAHDLSEGGLAVALAEMAFSGGMGVEVDLDRIPVPEGEALRPHEALFSESPTRLLFEVSETKAEALEAHWADLPLACIGTTREAEILIVRDGIGKSILEAPITDLKKAWQTPLI